ncbi:hypothetical protein SAMN04488688_110155 [Paenibacillus sp. cl141a]|nr:hypothetical protein SAMN04488688_110155 [Paenibacillus sp. cl141a]
MYASVFGLLGFGLMTSWTFGREYSDRTLKALLGLPISRGYLMPIGFAFTTLMLALVFGSTDIGTYLPWSVPALHLKESGVASFPLADTSYFLVFLIGLAGFIWTVKWLLNREHR